MYSRPSASQRRLPWARTKAIEGSTFRLRETTPPAIDCSLRFAIASDWERSLPVADAAISIEGPLKNLLFEGMLAHFRKINFDAESGAIRGPHRSSLRVDVESLADDVSEGFQDRKSTRLNS